MATSSPFTFPMHLFSELVSKLSGLQPPAWAIDEIQHRLVLLLNHILMQEPEATARLARLKGRVVRAQWRTLSMTLAATPAGLLELAASHKAADLSLVVTDDSPVSLVQTVIAGGKPPIKIEGDVQLAAEVQWLTQNVQWDLEGDLARIVGNVPAHHMANAMRDLRNKLREWVAKKS